MALRIIVSIIGTHYYFMCQLGKSYTIVLISRDITIGSTIQNHVTKEKNIQFKTGKKYLKMYTYMGIYYIL